MAEKKKEEVVVKPIKVTDNDTGMTYTLEFNRESVKFAEDRNFDIQEIAKKPMTMIPDLWFYAFRMHHKMLPREKTDKLLEGLGGIPDGLIQRLVELYILPYNVLLQGDDNSKNSKVVVEF